MEETSLPLSRFKEPDRVEEYGLACPICLSVPCTPRMAQCEHVCCDSCVKLWLTKSQTCPVCMRPTNVADLRPLGLIARRVYDNLEIRCAGYGDGCQHICKLSDLTAHEDVCPKVRVQCSHKGCNETPTRGFLKEHEASCKLTIRSMQVGKLVIPKLDSPNRVGVYPGANPDTRMGISPDRGSGSSHQFPTERETDSPRIHSRPGSLSSRPSSSSRRTDAQTRWQTDADGWSTWIVSGVKEHLAEAETAAKEGRYLHIQSPPQYTWPEGYCFVVRIYLSGDAEDSVGFCSVYFRFVEGNYDSQLAWPFSDKASIKLINSSVHKNMDARVCTRQQAETYLGRPPRSSGTGWGKFCNRDTLRTSWNGDCIMLGVKFTPHFASQTQAPRAASPVSPRSHSMPKRDSRADSSVENVPLRPKDLPQYKGPVGGETLTRGYSLTWGVSPTGPGTTTTHFPGIHSPPPQGTMLSGYPQSGSVAGFPSGSAPIHYKHQTRVSPRGSPARAASPSRVSPIRYQAYMKPV